MKTQKTFDNQELLTYIVKNLLTDPEICAALKNLATILNEKISMQLSYSIAKSAIPEILNSVEKTADNQSTQTSKHQKNRTRHQHKDWEKSTTNSLRIALRYRKKCNKPIEPELNAALVKRFPNYDSKTQTITRVYPKTHNRRTNWNKATAVALRSALAYRKKTAKPIEPELNAALVKRFPNYDSKTQTFANGCIHKRKTNWDKSTKNSLRIAFNRRKKHNKPIEPELNAALAKRFPNYDSKTQTFPREHIKKRATHWEKSTINSLRIALRYRKKHNKLIEPELNAALAKRFPNYDSKTQTFTRVHPKTHNRRTNWNKATAAALRSAFAYRKKTAKPIEPELNAALVKRFPNYDSKTQTFANGCIHKRKTNWDKSTKNSLRIAFNRRKRNNKPIEPELNTALANQFPDYDPKTQRFTRERGRTTTYGSRLLPLFSHITQRNTYALQFNNRQTGHPLLHSAIAPYDLCLLDTKMHIAIIRKPIAPNKNLLFIIDYARGTIVPESKRGLESVSYNATTHEFITTPQRHHTMHHWVLSPSHDATKAMFIPSNYPLILANALKKQTVIIDDNGIATTHPNMQLPQQTCNDTLNTELQKILSSRPTPTPAIDPLAPNIDEQASAPNQPNNNTKTLTVTVKPVKTTLDGTYNNVFVNGKKILTNHLNTDINLLFDNRLLAIHGTITDTPNLPQIPIWQIYDTKLQSKIPTHKQKFNNYNIYSTHIRATDEGLKIKMSNRAIYYIKAQRIIQESGQKRFALDNQKTK